MTDHSWPAEHLLTGIQDAARRIRAFWIASGHQILRLEGFMGVGKSRVAAILGADSDVVAIDDFKLAQPSSQSMLGHIDTDTLRARAKKLMESGKPLILEGVCLEELLPSRLLDRGCRVYLKRVSLPMPQSPLWHDGFDIEASESAEDPLHEDILRYHREYQPHNKSDVIFAIPEGTD